MPGADYSCAVQLPLAQWSAAMAAHVVDGVIFAIDVEDPDGLAFDFNAFAASRLNFACFADFYEIAHP